MEAVLVIFACVAGDCFPVVGEQTLHSQCMATSQAVAADWLKDHPGYSVKGLSCVDPKRLSVLLGRGEA